MNENSGAGQQVHQAGVSVPGGTAPAAMAAVERFLDETQAARERLANTPGDVAALAALGLVGVPSTTVELNAGEMLGQEKQFRGSIGGSCSPDRDFPTFLDWHRNGDLDLDALVTERYAIDDINDAAAALAEGHISGRSILAF